jgi:hypothetical protein
MGTERDPRGVEPRQGASKPKPATYTYGAHLASSPQLICAHLGSFDRMKLNEPK